MTTILKQDLMVHGSAQFTDSLLAYELVIDTAILSNSDTITIDPAAIGDATGKVVINGDLEVLGATTTINSSELTVVDKNIIIASGAIDSATADGAGITIDGANATLTYASSGDKLVANKALYVNTNRCLTVADEGNGNGLDADTIDGYDTATANTASTVVVRDASGNFSAGTITATLSGSATTLATARTIQLTGDVTGSTTFDGSANVSITASVGDNTHSHTSANISDATSANTANMIVKRGASGEVSTGALTVTGAITATGDITAYFSDSRLKDFSGTIQNALDKVNTLSGYYYTPNQTAASFGLESDGVSVGLSAQEVEAVLPEVVALAPFDRDSEGNSVSGEDYKTVKYERIVALLVESIKELSAKVDAQEQEIAKLKA